MTWLVERMLDLIELIVNWFNSRKYGAMARRFGRDLEEDDGRQGMIILQIDGLSHRTLQEAMAQGSMPNLRRLLERDGYRLHGWWCGIPSSTPAIQGGLMYGNNWNVPAFRWYEKAAGRSMVSKNPRDARRLQDRLSGGRPGLLADGSSYVNIFDGGARLSMFTVAALGGEHLFENVRGFGFATLLVFSPVRLLRIIGSVAWDLGRDLRQRLVSRFDTRMGRRRRPFSVAASMAQTFATVVFRELQTFGVLMDVYRRVPAIYANFYGYDDMAHQLGTLDPETARVLKSIDGRIHEIDVARRRFAARREYDLIILSDHGMSPSTPFRELYGQSLGETLAALVWQDRRQVAVDESGSGQWRSDAETRYLLEELESVKANLSPRGQRLATALVDFVARRVPAEPLEEADWDLARQRDLVLRNSGTVSLVYFTVTPHQMDLSEIELLYPGLLRDLVEHPGLGLVLGRERGQPMVMTLRGPRRLWPLDDDLVRDLLDGLPDMELAARQLCRQMSFPAAGDLVLYGRWDGDGHVIAFEPHWATHGGLGGEQNVPFIMVGPELPWDLHGITDPIQLHRLFMQRYGGNGGLARGPRQGQPAVTSDLTRSNHQIKIQSCQGPFV